MPPSLTLAQRLRRVRLLLMDVDGVLTDGSLWIAADGQEAKSFSVLDGTAMVLARLAGVACGFMSGRRTAVVDRRARECRVDYVAQGLSRKAAAMADICRRARVSAEQTAYIGDDLIDLPALRRAGLAIAVANAVPEARRAAHWVTRARGGQGAVREVVERILKAKGVWSETLSRYLGEHVPKN